MLLLLIIGRQTFHSIESNAEPTPVLALTATEDDVSFPMMTMYNHHFASLTRNVPLCTEWPLNPTTDGHFGNFATRDRADERVGTRPEPADVDADDGDWIRPPFWESAYWRSSGTYAPIFSCFTSRSETPISNTPKKPTYTYCPILLQAVISSQYLALKYTPTLTRNFLYANIQKANLILHMKNILNILQIVISILLIVTILLQQKGSGLGAAFGGDSAIYRTKRGAEKFIFRLTIVLSFLFLASALASLFIS